MEENILIQPKYDDRYYPKIVTLCNKLCTISLNNTISTNGFVNIKKSDLSFQNIFDSILNKFDKNIKERHMFNIQNSICNKYILEYQHTNLDINKNSKNIDPVHICNYKNLICLEFRGIKYIVTELSFEELAIIWFMVFMDRCETISVILDRIDEMSDTMIQSFNPPYLAQTIVGKHITDIIINNKGNIKPDSLKIISNKNDKIVTCSIHIENLPESNMHHKIYKYMQAISLARLLYVVSENTITDELVLFIKNNINILTKENEYIQTINTQYI
jgi:hypothetical protein